jgi:Sulfotransferase domain
MYKPVVIIGAPRSGTNMLRDFLVELPGVDTWPCDEINYIWRHGNISHKSDEFLPQLASQSICKYIRGQFDALQKKYHSNYIIEKTCANSLRVGFVNKVLPDAKYIFLIRDGLDVIGSAKLRWKAKLDILYILKKVRYVPWVDLPYYGFKYFGNRLAKIFSEDGRLSFWGPQLNDMDNLLKSYSLEQVCAVQWQRCIEASEFAFSQMTEDKIYKLRYEDFIRNPSDEYKNICTFLGLVQPDEEFLNNITSTVSVSSIGKGRNTLTQQQLDDILPIISKTLKKYGYET